MKKSKRDQRMDLLQQAQDLIQQVIDDLTEAEENSPESFQGGARADAIDSLENAISDIGSVEL